MFILKLEYDSRGLIAKETQVKNYLETIIHSPEKYIISAYTRRALAAQIKRTPLVYHSFYVITGGEMPFITLSFSATEKKIYSEGAWAINTEADMESYNSYKYETNEWEVQEIQTKKGIHTEKTIKNIIRKMDDNTTYYYRDHVSDKKDMENCNTALRNTLVDRGAA